MISLALHRPVSECVNVQELNTLHLHRGTGNPPSPLTDCLTFHQLGLLADHEHWPCPPADCRCWPFPLTVDEPGFVDCGIRDKPWSLAFYRLSKTSWMSCYCYKPHCILDNFLLSAAWFLLPSSTWKMEISNVLCCVVPTPLFLLLSIAVVATYWSTFGTWQAGVALGLLLQAATHFL
jgi:hypothetical protein